MREPRTKRLLHFYESRARTGKGSSGSGKVLSTEWEQREVCSRFLPSSHQRPEENLWLGQECTIDTHKGVHVPPGAWMLACRSCQRQQWTGYPQISCGRAAFPCESCLVNPFKIAKVWACKITYKCMYFSQEPEPSHYGFIRHLSLPCTSNIYNSLSMYALMSIYSTAPVLPTLPTFFGIFTPSSCYTS